MKFIDEITLTVRGGDGGDGAVAFRRERFRPNGGPSGGDGGRGGSVIFRADSNTGTLLDLKYRHRLEAKRGENGQGRDCHGRGAEDLVVCVPVGTAVFDVASGLLVCDLVSSGQEVVAARGGIGGMGNIRFSTPSNRAPRKATPGEKGEERLLRLELRLLADVGLVGMPSVGKSSIIARLSAARPKVAEYHFTTLVPNLGVVRLSVDKSFVMADIPGLVRGASKGVGLGHRFLKHVQRTAVLLHVVAPDHLGENDLLRDFDVLREELHAFSPELSSRPCLVVMNKADLPGALEAAVSLRKALEKRELELIVCSAATGEGLEELRVALGKKLAERMSPIASI